MKFPYISVDYIFADVRAELKQMNQAGEINDEDCLNWLVEVLREIGFHNYEKSFEVLHIKNHVAKLPKDFYLADEIWLVDATSSVTNAQNTIWFTTEGTGYIGKQILRPGDSSTGKFCLVKDGQRANLKDPAYIIRYPGVVRTSFDQGTLGLIYLHLPKDENGGFLMQDEINTIKCAKAYLVLKNIYEKFLGGKIAKYIYDDVKNDYSTYLDLAQTIFKFPDPVDDRYMAEQQNHRYDRFKMR